MPDLKYMNLYRSLGSGRVPPAASMGLSQLAVNFADKRLFTKDTYGNILALGERATIVDRLVTDTTVTYPKTHTSSYLVQRKNLAALQGVSADVDTRMSRSQAHAREEQQITITGTATGGGSYTPFLGTTINYTNGQSANNFANQVATAINLVSGVVARVNNNVVTVQWQDFKPHNLMDTQNQDGFDIAVARIQGGSNANDKWAIVASDGTDWYVFDVAETIENHLVYVRTDERLLLIKDDLIEDIPHTFVSDDQIPTPTNPSRSVTSQAGLLITPAQVKAMFDGLRIYRDFEGLDAANINSLTDANHQVHKTYYVTTKGSVTVAGTTYNVDIGDTLYKSNAGWVHNKAATGGTGKNSATITISKTAHGLVTGDIVFFDNASDGYIKARANVVNSCGITAFVKKIDDDNFDVTFSGIVDGVGALNLTVGETYYLSQATAGTTQVAIPTSGLVKFCYQAIAADKVLVLPLLAYDATASNAGSAGSYTRAELINIITNNKGAGADYFFAGDGTFKQLDTKKLFDTRKTAGSQAGVTPDFGVVSNAITINADINRSRIEFIGIGGSSNDYDVTLGANTFSGYPFVLFYNTGQGTAVLKTVNQNFINPIEGKRMKSMRLDQHQTVLLIGDGDSNWLAIHSDFSKLIDDSNQFDNKTWSSKEIAQNIAALINDKATTDTDVTWSVAKIEAAIEALIADGATSGDKKTWSIDKIKAAIKVVSDAIGALIDDASYSTSKVWSSKKTQDYVDLAQTHRLVADSLMGYNVPVHFDAFYRKGMAEEKSASISGGRNIYKWYASSAVGGYMHLPQDLKASSEVNGRPGFYTATFDGTAYGELYGSAKGNSSNASVRGVDVMDDLEFSIIAVIRPKSLPTGVNISSENDYAAVVHNSNGFVLGFAENTLNFSCRDDSNNWLRVSHRIDGHLDKDMIVIAHKNADNRVYLEVRIDGKTTITDNTPMANPYNGAQAGIIEFGRGTNNKNYNGEMMEIAIVNGGRIWQNKNDYFNYFARKWGVDI